MVYILLAPGFEEAEALVPADVLRRAGVEVSLVGLYASAVSGSHGISVNTDLTAEQVSLSSGDTIMIPGGPGYAKVGESEIALSLIRQAAADESMWVAAICAAPTLLADMGLMAGKQAVCYPGMEDQLQAKEVSLEPSVESLGILTSRGAGTAAHFAFSLLAMLFEEFFM